MTEATTMQEWTCEDARQQLNRLRSTMSEIVARAEQAGEAGGGATLAQLDELRVEEASLLAWMSQNGCDEVKQTRMETVNEITIHAQDDRKNIPPFKAPEDGFAARSLWVFLVENLREGYEIELEIPGDSLQLSRTSGAPLPEELYRAIMRGDVISNEQQSAGGEGPPSTRP
jgi:hypothetical protein